MNNSARYYNIYYASIKTIVIVLLLVMLIQCKQSYKQCISEDKFYFHLNLNENIDDFKGIVYSIHDNIHDKDPIVNIILQEVQCPQDYESIILFHWPGSIHHEFDDIRIQATKEQELNYFKKKHFCVQRTKMQEQNCKKNCPITSFYIQDDFELVFERDSKEQPIVDIIVHPDYPCFNRWKQLPIIHDDYINLLRHRNITKQCQEPLQDIYNYLKVAFISAEQFLLDNLVLDKEAIHKIAQNSLFLMAEKKLSMIKISECRQFEKDKVTIAEIIISHMLRLFWVFQIMKCSAFTLMTLLELWNYKFMGYKLNPLKYSILITGILLIINFLENFLISGQFKTVEQIVRYYENFGDHDCFRITKLNEFFSATDQSLAGRSHSYENIMNVHFYIIAILICIFIGIFYLAPKEETNQMEQSEIKKPSLDDKQQLEINLRIKFLKYNLGHISEHNSEYSHGSRKQLELQTI